MDQRRFEGTNPRKEKQIIRKIKTKRSKPPEWVGRDYAERRIRSRDWRNRIGRGKGGFAWGKLEAPREQTREPYSRERKGRFIHFAWRRRCLWWLLDFAIFGVRDFISHSTSVSRIHLTLSLSSPSPFPSRDLYLSFSSIFVRRCSPRSPFSAVRPELRRCSYPPSLLPHDLPPSHCKCTYAWTGTI